MKTLPKTPTKVKSAKQEREQEALLRATSGRTWSNYADIFKGFMAMGIAEENISPRENVFTYQAWRALGRYVRKGEHGVKICTWIPTLKKTKDKDGKDKEVAGSIPRTVTVFHVTQTDALAGKVVA